MIIWAFLAAALAAAGIYSLAAGFVFWKTLLVFIGAYALSNIAYALFEFRGFAAGALRIWRRLWTPT